MATERCIAGICFIALDPAGPKFFGFSEFLAALALMILVWTTTDIRYRFRIATAPIPLYRLTFWVVAGIGSLTLLTDLWRASGWLVPRGQVLTAESWQAMLGAAFLLTFLTWAWFAHLHPPCFGRLNARRYADFLFSTILNGSSADMATIGTEITRSIPSLVDATPSGRPRLDDEADDPAALPEWQGLAHDIFLLIADPRFCRVLVTSSPGTIYAIFQEVSKTKKYQMPIGQFGRNIFAAAIEDKNSFLYHEQDGYDSGLIGYIKPLSQSLFGSYPMVEGIGRLLDPDHRLVRSWSEPEWAAYIGAVLIVLEDYIEQRSLHHSFVLYRAFDLIADAANDLYKIDGLDSASWDVDVVRRLAVSVDFCRRALKILDKRERSPHLTLRARDRNKFYDTTVYDNLASLILSLIEHAAMVRQNSSLAWMIRHNTVWAPLIGLFNESGPAALIVQFKLRRKIYDEIVTAKNWPNYRNMRLLLFCIHMMGFTVRKDSGIDRDYRALHRAVLAWTKRNFFVAQQKAPHVVKDCLPAGLSYDADNGRLVRTYEINALRNEPERVYFKLDRPRRKKATLN